MRRKLGELMALNRSVPGAQAAGSDRGSNAESTTGSLAAISSGQRVRWTLGQMVGRSAAMERLFLQMRYLSKHLRLALIEGERGTGKLLAAETLHELSLSRSSGFVACPAAQFLEDGGSAARIEQARGGTLYLSQLELLNHEQQGRLLHLLEWVQQQHARSGGLRQAEGAMPRALLLSSRRALRPLVLYGKFRGDLYQQISAVHLLLPPLRDRREDVAMLVEVFLARVARQYGKPLRGAAQEVLPHLLAYGWPGNLAELQAIISRAAARAEGEWLLGRDVVLPAPENQGAASSSLVLAPRLGRFPGAAAPAIAPAIAVWPARAIEAFTPPPSAMGAGAAGQAGPVAGPVAVQAALDAEGGPRLDPNLDRAILRHIRRVLASVDGNKLRAARLLGISRSTLYRLLDAEAASAPAGENRPAENRIQALRQPPTLQPPMLQPPMLQPSMARQSVMEQ